MKFDSTFDALYADMICLHRTESGPALPYHHHNGYEVLLLVEGEIEFFIGENRYILFGGDVLFLKPGEPHHRGEILCGPYNRIIINFTEEMLQRLSTERTDLSLVFNQATRILSCDKRIVGRLTHIADKCVDSLTSTKYGDDILAQNHMKETLIILNRQYDKVVAGAGSIPMSDVVANTIAYIDFNLSEDITLEKLAGYTHHNKTYISRCFKKAKGISIPQYINEKKIALAKRYLMDGFSPSDACFMTGFNNYSSFSRIFSKIESCSPREYQNRVRA